MNFQDTNINSFFKLEKNYENGRHYTHPEIKSNKAGKQYSSNNISPQSMWGKHEDL